MTGEAIQFFAKSVVVYGLPRRSAPRKDTMFVFTSAASASNPADTTFAFANVAGTITKILPLRTSQERRGPGYVTFVLASAVRREAIQQWL